MLFGWPRSKGTRARRHKSLWPGRSRSDSRLSVNFGTDGYVKETHDDAVGNHVMKDQHLAVVYSPEFLAVSGGFLSANERTPVGSAVMKDNGAHPRF